MAEKECLFTSIIVDPDMGCRARLKEATKAVATFGTVAQCSKLDEATGVSASQGRTDVMFISARFDSGQVYQFIKQAKGTKSSEDCAFVLLLGKSQQDGANTATKMIGGADGLLFEPFSIDSLVEITQLASRVKKDRSRQREEAGIKLLVKQAIPLIVNLAEMKSAGYEATSGIKSLQEISAVLKTLDPQLLEFYYDQAVEMFENAPPPDPTKKKIYRGASSRVRKRVEEKLLATLADQKLPDEQEPA